MHSRAGKFIPNASKNLLDLEAQNFKLLFLKGPIQLLQQMANIFHPKVDSQPKASKLQHKLKQFQPKPGKFQNRAQKFEPKAKKFGPKATRF